MCIKSRMSIFISIYISAHLNSIIYADGNEIISAFNFPHIAYSASSTSSTSSPSLQHSMPPCLPAETYSIHHPNVYPLQPRVDEKMITITRCYSIIAICIVFFICTTRIAVHITSSRAYDSPHGCVVVIALSRLGSAYTYIHALQLILCFLFTFISL